MSPEQAFYQAILENPSDAAQRLVFADWLEERDDPVQQARGAFIRLQCQLSGGALLAPERRQELKQREQELLTAHAPAWLGPLAGIASRWGFTRGTAWLQFAAGRFIDRKTHSTLKDWFPRAGVQELSLLHGTRRLRDVFQSPLLGRLHSLSFAYAEIGDREAHALAASPHLAHVRTLALSHNQLTPFGAAALLGSPRLGRLERLYLERNRLFEAGPGGMRGLAALPALARLQSLNLEGNALDDEAVSALASSPHLGGLTALDLPYNNIMLAGVRALAESPYLANLAFLDLRSNPLGRGAGRALAASVSLSKLANLSVGDTGMEPDDQQALRERFGERVECTVPPLESHL
jgi:uncharacterized protein (TIGR02996 family)